MASTASRWSSPRCQFLELTIVVILVLEHMLIVMGVMKQLEQLERRGAAI